MYGGAFQNPPPQDGDNAVGCKTTVLNLEEYPSGEGNGLLNRQPDFVGAGVRIPLLPPIKMIVADVNIGGVKYKGSKRNPFIKGS